MESLAIAELFIKSRVQPESILGCDIAELIDKVGLSLTSTHMGPADIQVLQQDCAPVPFRGDSTSLRQWIQTETQDVPSEQQKILVGGPA